MRMVMVMVMCVVSAACGATLVGAPLVTAEQARSEGLAQLLAASERHDAAAIAALLDPELNLGGVWFDDTTCRRFASAGTVVGPDLDIFARCLAAVSLRSSDRSSPISGVAVVTYEPGLELEIRFVSTARGTKLRFIGFVARTTVEDALPTVTQRALEARRTEPAVLDDAARAVLDAKLVETKSTSMALWLKVCIDDTGAVTAARPQATWSPTVDEIAVAQARRWSFEPFLLDGKPAAVCALVGSTHPDGTAAPTFPVAAYALDRPSVPPAALERDRVAGIKNLLPDGADKQEIHESNKDKIVGSYKMCVDATGAVDVVTVLKSTGLLRYDDFIVRSLRTWRYKPQLVGGKPSGVCTAITFIYSQR
jgi:hypothetical protein